MPGAVSGDLAAARAALVTEFRYTRTELLAAANAQAGAAQEKVDRALSILDRRTGDVLVQVDSAIATTNAAVTAANTQLSRANGTLAGMREDLRPALVSAASVTKQADEAMPLSLDCEYNPDCVFNQYVGASKGIECAVMSFCQMSTDVRAALPAAINTWQGIGTNMNGITANINRLTERRWYDRLLGYGLNGVVIYRNLNPAANLTSKGAQAVSSRQ